MVNYLKGFTTSALLLCSVFIFIGAQFGGSQHFGDIIANSVTITDKNGFGGFLKIVDKDGDKLISIENGKIEIYNSENVEVVSIKSSKEGKGSVHLKNGGSLNTFNENGIKTSSLGENRAGEGILSTFNNNSKLTSLLGSNDGGYGKLSLFDDQGKESLHLIQSLTTFNKDGRITGKYGTNNSGNGSVLLYDKFGNRGWFKSGKKS